MSRTRNDSIMFSKRTHYVSALSSAAMKPVEEKETQDEEEFGENEEPKPLQAPLTEDTYSILLVAKAWTSPLYFAVLFVLSQLLLLALIIYSLLFFTRPDNELDVTGINSLVVVGQGLAVILAACTAEDLLNALAFMFITVDEKLIASIPELTKTRWRVAFGLKFIEGTLCLFVIFLLIVQSTSVIGLCLNFAALSFVWAIDDTFFSLGQRGFFSKALAECTHRISNTQIPVHKHEKVHKYRNYAFYIITLLSITSWSIIIAQQASGHFVCDKLLVQFDDVYEPEISSLSGVYKRKSFDRLLYPIYEGEKIPNTEGSYPIIAYCISMHVWTLTIREHEDEHSVCEWKAKSPPRARTTNILDVNEDWEVNVKETTESGAKGPLPFEHMSIECLNDKKCDESQQYGLSCQFRKPCENLIPYRDSNVYNLTYFDNTAGFFNASYTILKEDDGKLVENKNRPVWYQKTNRSFDFIYFQGYRWNSKEYLLDEKELSLYQDETKWLSQARDIMKKGLVDEKATPEVFRLLYSSEPMLLSTPKDKSAPTFLQWYNALGPKFDEYEPEEGLLVCAGCSDYQKCRNNGKCENGECQCKKCSSGHLCEIVTCDKIFADYFYT